ncbi:hypothetical protein EVAR_76886_1 [Eumeta japonica]|uniref:Uncharacterized protein n=1 Tax=Eumeta variegata TaxID=151549 RepID=A0A4C1SET3_EUMVA|nr:hypothetical protein EVAR_76886_1 [Eumeta japonica]
MVCDVYCFLKKGAKSDKEALERTSEATITSVRTVRRIVDEIKKFGLLAVFRTTGKKRSGKKKVTDIDSFDHLVKELVNEKVAAMSASKWAKLCKKVKEIENEYIKSDHVADMVTDQFVISADDESDSDDDDDDNETTEPTHRLRLVSTQWKAYLSSLMIRMISSRRTLSF